MAPRPCPPQRNWIQLLAGIRRRACRRWCSRSCSCSRCSWWCSSSLSQQITGKDKALELLNAKDRAAERSACRWKKLGKISLDDENLAAPRPGWRRRSPERDRVRGLYEGLAGAGNDARRPAPQRTQQGAGFPRKGVSARAPGTDRSAEPADRRAAPPVGRARGCAQCFREA